MLLNFMVKSVRENLGLKALFVAHRLGLSPSSYSEIENGLRPISLERLVDIYIIFEEEFNNAKAQNESQEIQKALH